MCVVFSWGSISPAVKHNYGEQKRVGKKYTYIYYIYIYISKKTTKNTRVFSSDASNKYGAHHFGPRKFQKNLHGHQTSSRILPCSTQVTVEDPGMDAAKSSIKENKTTVKSNQFLRDQCCDWVGWVGWGIFVSLISCWLFSACGICEKTTDVCCFLLRQQKFLVDLQYNFFCWFFAKTHPVDVLKFQKRYLCCLTLRLK